MHEQTKSDIDFLASIASDHVNHLRRSGEHASSALVGRECQAAINRLIDFVSGLDGLQQETQAPTSKKQRSLPRAVEEFEAEQEKQA